MGIQILLTSKWKPQPRETVGFSFEFIIKYFTREGSSELSIFSLLFLARVVCVTGRVSCCFFVFPKQFLGVDLQVVMVHQGGGKAPAALLEVNGCGGWAGVSFLAICHS